MTQVSPPLSKEDFIARLRQVGADRYHDKHPYHLLMHQGLLTPLQLREWVRNRYYYQTRIPIKDALILGKSDDEDFIRLWKRRIVDQRGERPGEGGLEKWLRLAEGVGLKRAEVESFTGVLPGVKAACDGYVDLVRNGSLLEAVASSLTEFFAWGLMSRRIEAWEKHYPWVGADSLAYFRTRVVQARQDSEGAIEYVCAWADTHALQMQAIAALTRKTQILWSLLDALHQAYVEPHDERGRQRA